MEQILQEILKRLDILQAGQKSLEAGQKSLEAKYEKLETGQQGLQQQMNDMRDTVFVELEGIHKEMGAMRDMQAIAMGKWTQSMDILERVEILLNEREAERVAVDATLVNHEKRITNLEQKAG